MYGFEQEVRHKIKTLLSIQELGSELAVLKYWKVLPRCNSSELPNFICLQICPCSLLGLAHNQDTASLSGSATNFPHLAHVTLYNNTGVMATSKPPPIITGSPKVPDNR